MKFNNALLVLLLTIGLSLPLHGSTRRSDLSDEQHSALIKAQAEHKLPELARTLACYAGGSVTVANFLAHLADEPKSIILHTITTGAGFGLFLLGSELAEAENKREMKWYHGELAPLEEVRQTPAAFGMIASMGSMTILFMPLINHIFVALLSDGRYPSLMVGFLSPALLQWATAEIGKHIAVRGVTGAIKHFFASNWDILLANTAVEIIHRDAAPMARWGARLGAGLSSTAGMMGSSLICSPTQEETYTEPLMARFMGLLGIGVVMVSIMSLFGADYENRSNGTCFPMEDDAWKVFEGYLESSLIQMATCGVVQQVTDPKSTLRSIPRWAARLARQIIAGVRAYHADGKLKLCTKS